MRPTRRHALLCLWLAAELSATGCQAPLPAVPVAPAAAAASASASAPAAARATIDFDESPATGKLVVDLPDPRTVLPPVAVTALAAEPTAALVARMEPPPVFDNAAAPPLRAPTTPPPSGETQPIVFAVTAAHVVPDAPPGAAPPATPAAEPTKPLAPPQITPAGDVARESEIRIRFDEPMVPVAEIGPVRRPIATIAPPVAGTWRWIDTRVAQFTAAGARLAQATDYTVTVVAGTRALSGDALAADQIDHFATPGVTITGVFPHTPVRTDSALALGFDQAVDPAQIVPRLRIDDARGGAPIGFHVVARTDAEARWLKNPSLAYDAAKARPRLGDHIVLVAPNAAWPSGMQGRVTLAAGAPSREGPRLAAKPSVVRFDVAPEFRVVGLACNDAKPRMTGAVCSAFGYMTVEMSTPIAVGSYHAEDIQVTGEPFDDNKPSGVSVGLLAPLYAYRPYAIAVHGDLADVYGQPLAGARDLAFTTSPERFDAYLSADSGLQVLDPRFEIPQWVVTADAVSSLHVQLYRVEPADYFAYEDYESGVRTTPPGTPIVDKMIDVGPRHGVIARIDLRPALGAAGTGHVIAVVTAPAATPKHATWFQPRVVAWFQVTKLGLVARVDGDRANAWVRDIAPASFLTPVAGATAAILSDERHAPPSERGTTDAEGHALLALLPPKPPLSAEQAAAPAPVRVAAQRSSTALLAVTTATDSTFAAMAGDGHQIARERDAMWYATDDRFTYKPGETVYVKGWVRWTTTGTNPDIELPAAGDAIAYSLRDAAGNKLASGDAPVTDQGGFDVAVAIPNNANLGTAAFHFETHGRAHSLPIEIAEFRTPPFSVALTDDVTHAGATPLVLGERIEMRAEAKYYAGGGLPGAAIRWDAHLVPAEFRPAGWDLFQFDPPAPRDKRTSYARRYGDHRAHDVNETRDASLTGASAAGAVFGIAALAQGRPAVLTVDATVTDVDRMAIRATSRPILVHPSDYYVGVRLAPEVDDQPSDKLEIVVTDIDGNAVPGVPVHVDIEGVHGSERWRADAKILDTQQCDVTSAATPVPCTFTRGDAWWAYSATAHVTDRRGRTNAAEYDIPWIAWDKDEPLRLTPDRASYRPGDVAKLELVSDVVPATAIVSFARNGVFAQKRLELTASSTTFELPITPAFISNVHIDVDRFAKRRVVQKGSALPLPEHTHTSLELPVSIENARLVMTAKPTAKIVEPGAQATFDVDVRRDGAPVGNAEVALMVVDEAVLALSYRTHEDPLPDFYRELEDGSTDLSTLDMVEDAGTDLVGAPGVRRFALDTLHGSGTGTGEGYGEGHGSIGAASYGTVGYGMGTSVVQSRKDFRANAVFSPRLHTDAHGHVSVTIKMPDNLTRYRIVAIATASTRYFGKAEGTIIAQRKLNARTVAPRFLTQGDRFSLPIVVQNLDSAPRTVDVAVRPVNLVAIGATGKRVTVDPGQRAEVRFDFRTASRGRAAVQTIAIAGDFADASTVQLPVYEPATTEAFATYGVVDGAPKAEQLRVPDDVFPDVGGVDVQVASSELQSLTDAFEYLYAYPYECAEQRSARMLATSAMADVLDAFDAPGRPTRADLDATADADLVRLVHDQLRDGGWGYWPESPSDPYVTQQVLQAIAARQLHGSSRDRGAEYVRRDLQARMAVLGKRLAARIEDRDPRVSGEADVAMAAADLTALAAAGIDARATAAQLHATATALGEYPVDAKARLLALVAGRAEYAAMRKALLADLLSATHETADSASVTTSFVDADRMLLVSSTKTTALALDAIMREAPEHALVTKLARGLLEARRRGRWISTQENLAVLVTMRRFFDRYEKATPAFTGKLWLGGAGYAERAFAGHSTAIAEASVGWPQLTAAAGGAQTQTLGFAKEGTGRMYYRVGITYAPKRVDLPPLEAGFLVRRSYAAVDDPDDVRRGTDGRWHVKLGARVLVTVEALVTTRRYGVALVDPLPAGFEAVNPRLAVAERAVPGATTLGWDHVNMRDERAEAFASELGEGSHVFAYSARATTPGTFVAAPAKAEEMYAPETFGRSAGSVVVVE